MLFFVFPFMAAIGAAVGQGRKASLLPWCLGARSIGRRTDGRTDGLAANGGARDGRRKPLEPPPPPRVPSSDHNVRVRSVIALRGRADGRGGFEAVAGGRLEDGDDVKGGYVDEVGIAKAAREEREGGRERV